MKFLFSFLCFCLLLIPVQAQSIGQQSYPADHLPPWTALTEPGLADWLKHCKAKFVIAWDVKNTAIFGKSITVNFELNRAGKILGTRVVDGSADKRANDEVLAVVRRVGILPPGHLKIPIQKGLTVTFLGARENSGVSSDVVVTVSGPKIVDEDSLEPWLNDCKRRIKRVRDEIAKDAFNGRGLICFCRIFKDGHLDSLSVIQTSGYEETDRTALRIIETAANFRATASEAPSRSGVVVQFLGSDVIVKLKGEKVEKG